MQTKIILFFALIAFCLSSHCSTPVGQHFTQTEILWDSWGVPHIYAPTEADLYYAFGWTQMLNHGNLIASLYGQARGRGAVIFLRWVQVLAGNNFNAIFETPWDPQQPVTTPRGLRDKERALEFSAADNNTFEVFHGESYVAITEFGEQVRAKVLLTYGNATQPHSPHVGDQLTLFAEKKLRDAWLSRQEVEENLAKREVLER
ncbi:MAG: penicillin acylase family protein [Bacteroidales bacterium]|nr:penicillin acylase family protein [Bacteroidales bacterium]